MVKFVDYSLYGILLLDFDSFYQVHAQSEIIKLLHQYDITDYECNDYKKIVHYVVNNELKKYIKKADKLVLCVPNSHNIELSEISCATYKCNSFADIEALDIHGKHQLLNELKGYTNKKMYTKHLNIKYSI